MNKTYRVILENTYVLSIKGRDRLFQPRGEDPLWHLPPLILTVGFHTISSA